MPAAREKTQQVVCKTLGHTSINIHYYRLSEVVPHCCHCQGPKLCKATRRCQNVWDLDCNAVLNWETRTYRGSYWGAQQTHQECHSFHICSYGPKRKTNKTCSCRNIKCCQYVLKNKCFYSGKRFFGILKCSLHLLFFFFFLKNPKWFFDSIAAIFNVHFAVSIFESLTYTWVKTP